MNSKTYKLPNGKKAVFEYDVCGIGKVTLECMDELMGMIADKPLVRCKECKYKRIYDGETKYYYCALEDRPNRQWSIDEMDYCSWAEREGE